MQYFVLATALLTSLITHAATFADDGRSDAQSPHPLLQQLEGDAATAEGARQKFEAIYDTQFEGTPSALKALLAILGDHNFETPPTPGQISLVQSLIPHIAQANETLDAAPIISQFAPFFDAESPETTAELLGVLVTAHINTPADKQDQLNTLVGQAQKELHMWEQDEMVERLSRYLLSSETEMAS